MKQEPRRWLTSRYMLIAVGVTIASVGIILLIRIGYAYEWTGFGNYETVTTAREDASSPQGTKVTVTEGMQRGKTLWDWLQLLIIPVVLAIGGYVFNRTEKAREVARTEQQAQAERGIAADNQRETALQTYFDRMSELMLDKNLREKLPHDAAWAVAQARTDTTLQRLDTERKARLVRFLGQAQLLNKKQAGISLHDASLQGVDLSLVNLEATDLQNANLQNANLVSANLQGAILLSANLQGANLNGADLQEADLNDTNLQGAELFDANLQGAYLLFAKLQGAILFRANLQGAELSDADLRGADLISANLQGADLTGTDLRGAQNITVDQIKAAENWGEAIYNDDFRAQLGLPPNPTQTGLPDATQTMQP